MRNKRFIIFPPLREIAVSDILKTKIRQLYTFLKEANQLRFRPIRQVSAQVKVIRLAEMPDHPALHLSRPVVSENEETETSNALIRITRPKLTPCPTPPYATQEWLLAGWDDPKKQVSVTETQNKVRHESFDEDPERVIAYSEWLSDWKIKKEEDAPTPPTSLDFWLEPNWKESVTEPLPISQREITFSEKFVDDDLRVEAYNGWLETRNVWVEPELLAHRALHFYEKFYDTYASLEKDGEQLEILVADGCLQWTTRSDVDDQVTIDHPILLKRVELKFEPEVPQFLITDTDKETELYGSLFVDLSQILPTSIRNRTEELSQLGCHPLGWDDTTAFLKAFVQTLSPSNGEFLTEPPDTPIGSIPRLFRDPLVIIRRRSTGIANAVNAIIDDIDQREVFPPSLSLITGEDAEWGNDALVGNGFVVECSAQGDPQSPSRNISDDDILLAKEANEEQLQIIRKLESSGSVIVQGPPGTGKTHTIGNLIGHLLSQGKSILVTAQTSKALRVVRDKIPEMLRPLAVSVLGSDQSARQQLETSIGAITERMTNDSSESLLSKSISYESQRRDLIKKRHVLSTKLRIALENEYREISIGGKQYTPVDAAKYVKGQAVSNSWIPSKVKLGSELNLSEDELTKLYSLGMTFSEEEERDSRYALPNFEELPNERKFRVMASEYKELTFADLTLGRHQWNAPGTGSSESLAALLNQLEYEFSDELRTQSWRPYAIVSGILGGTHRIVWERFIENIEDASELQVQLKLHIQHSPAINSNKTNHEQKRIISEICDHLDNGGKLGFMQLVTRSEWKQFIKASTVMSGVPDHPDHFKALKAVVDLENARKSLSLAWDQLIGSFINKTYEMLGNNPEQACRAIIPEIKRSLEWHDKVWLPLSKRLSDEGIKIGEIVSAIPRAPSEITEYLVIETLVISMLTPLLVTELHRRKLVECEKSFVEIERLAHSVDPKNKDVGCLGRILNAVSNRDVDAYQESLDYLRRISVVRKIVDERDALLAKLKLVAPVWAEQINCRVSPHNMGSVPGNISFAWIWRQLNDELNERDLVNANDIQHEIDKVDITIRELTLLLIDSKSWGNQLGRLKKNNKIRQALVGWLETQKRLLSTRKLEQRQDYLIESRRLMKQSAQAVPVWIMPISIVAESFDPMTTRFDVVIIDEASQADLNALIPMYLAKQIVIVGDHEQVTPLGVGQGQAILDNLRKQTLKDIPNSHLFDSKFSIYDIGRQSFGDGIRLVEHFRCVPEIIGFSNKLSYDGAIRPLRESNSSDLKPACVSCYVDGTRDRDVNREEARRIVDLIKAMILHPKYINKTIGVIPMVGNDQTFSIQSLIHKEISATEIETRRIQVGVSSEFQGDERDIIFLSMVDSPIDEGAMRLTGDGAFELNKKRYNVAASRARDQLWVVHSFDANLHLKLGDLRLALLTHIKDPFAAMRGFEKSASRAESPFELSVLKILTGAGYNVVTQWQVGYYRIDMVVEGGGKRLAIECDGDRFHPLDKLAEDIQRQTILERLGWQFVRIRGSAFYRDEHDAMEPVFKRLAELEIPKEANLDLPQISDLTLIHELDQIIDAGFVLYSDGIKSSDSDITSLFEDELSVDSEDNENDENQDNQLNILDCLSSPVLGSSLNVTQSPVTVIDIIKSFGGQASLDDVVKELSRAKGFVRLGKNVRAEILKDVRKQMSSNQLILEDGLVKFMNKTETFL